MLNKLYPYLVQNKSMQLPGLGILHLDVIPAQLDMAEKKYKPNSYTFHFEVALDETEDSQIEYLASLEKKSKENIISEMKEFVNQIKSNIRVEGSHKLSGIGTFHKDASDAIYFESAEPIKIQRETPVSWIIRDVSEHHVLVGDTEKTSNEMIEWLEKIPEDSWFKKNWFTAALIVASIITVVYIGYSTGFSLKGFSNSSKINCERPLPGYKSL